MGGELIILVTVPNEDEANRIAESLVAERLAACVNVVPAVESIYRWEGKVVRDHELLLIIKSTAERYASLETRVKSLHSYSTPEIVAFSIDHGSPEYLAWLRHSTDSEGKPTGRQ
jgi:periplasmic divalent cation tolerance protein